MGLGECFAQYGYLPLKPGDPSFTTSKLDADTQLWYGRFWSIIKNRTEDPSPDQLAATGDNYNMGRQFGTYVTGLLDVYRTTGDLKILDEIDRLLQTARGKLRDAWDDGTTDGFINWRNYRTDVGVSQADIGTDRNRQLDEILSASVIAEVTWAFRLNANAGIASPAGINYKERADFWQNFLQNHFEAKWRKRTGRTSGFPFLIKNLEHIYITFIRYHYYMAKLTGRSDYMIEAKRMAAVVSKNMCSVPTSSGANYVWPHIVYFDTLTHSDPLPSLPEGQPHVYVSETLLSALILGFEGFEQFADPSVMKSYAGGLRDFILDGGSPMIAVGICGDVPRTGIMNGMQKTVVPRTTTTIGTVYPRYDQKFFSRWSYPLMSMWDSTGKLLRTTDIVYDADINKTHYIFPMVGHILFNAAKQGGSTTVNNTQQVVSFTLINASTGKDVKTLVSGETISLKALGLTQITLRANTNPSVVGSVKFSMTGAQTYTHIENSAPYALFGDNQGSYYSGSWHPPVLGSYTMTAVPYSLRSASGVAGTSNKITFSFVE